MKVNVVLFGPNARLLPPGSQRNSTSLDVADGATIADVLDALGVPSQGRSYLQLNGAREEPAAAVHDGDEVRVVVPLGGG